jgi:predicted secreted Zn-dependent protease
MFAPVKRRHSLFRVSPRTARQLRGREIENVPFFLSTGSAARGKLRMPYTVDNTLNSLAFAPFPQTS